MPEFGWLLAGLVLGGVLSAWWARRGAPKAVSRQPRLYDLAAELTPFFQQMAHARELRGHPAFQEGCELLRGPGFNPSGLLDYFRGSNQVLASMAMEALAKREGVDEEILAEVIAELPSTSNWARYFALSALDVHARSPVVYRVLQKIDRTWGSDMATGFLKEFVQRRKASGETPIFQGIESAQDKDLAVVFGILQEIDSEHGTALSEEFGKWRSEISRPDTVFLRSVGRFRDEAGSQGSDIVEVPSLTECVDKIESAMKRDRPRSVLVAGEAGVGKSTAIDLLTRRLRGAGWTVFEASAVQVLAGAVYVGELEGRVQKLLASLREQRNNVWVIPSFQQLAQLGRHRQSDVSILDMILPAIVSAEIPVVGEVDSRALELVFQRCPRLAKAMEVIRVPPLSRDETLRIAEAWVECVSPSGGARLFEPSTLREAYELSQQYLSSRANPGALLDLLRLTRDHRMAHGGLTDLPLKIDDFLHALSSLSGLPLTLLDDREALDLDSVRRFFAARIMGQAEAVNCFVERIAMMKAGLTDPTRPQGVFFLTGPTGTGKTEIAKALAEFLFGSPERMIRLDMSEFQTWEAASRIFGSADDPGHRKTLVHEIRKQPFSVVLLDEFEKAHPNIWDIFLQLFDDGRLTGLDGNPVDCRQTLILMTANIGVEAQDGSVGFRTSPQDIAAGAQKALSQTFRQEFLNRLDRVISFQPLSKPVMREILRKELDVALQRRGLRTRQWAVEFDESALEFLLTTGFSTSLGARPLRRAIERHLLSPLAAAIVTHEFPDGDQFLFVRSNGGSIQVEFVDPDSTGEGLEPAREVDGESSILCRLETLALEAAGEAREVAYLSAQHKEILDIVEGTAWKERKRSSLQKMSSPEFWREAGRFAALSEAEYRDRIETGLETAGSLLMRLAGPNQGSREHYAAHLVRRLAERLYLLREAIEGLSAGDPQDAFLMVEAARDPTDQAGSDGFGSMIASMYRSWANQRGMSLEVLEETSRAGSAESYKFVAGVSGYAAFRLLRSESGLHVLERPPESWPASQSTRRYRVRVTVAAQPDAPLPRKLKARQAAALDCLARARGSESAITRRYREEPSPLVRDGMRGWRTGRLDQVLAGNFDLFVA